MKLVKPSVEIWEQQPGIDGIYKAIERASRICYKSESNITEDSAKPMVDRLMKSGHYSMLEQGTVYLSIDNPKDIVTGQKKYSTNPYSRVYKNTLEENWSCPRLYVTTNMRTIVENGWEEDLKYICEPTEYHEKRVTAHFICDRATAQEITRHRTSSFAMESQRYCNYSKDKFNNEITCTIPCWTSLTEDSYKSFVEIIGKTPPDNYKEGELEFLSSCVQAEQYYFMLLNKGWKPEQARTVLPNACKTELVMTCFISDWKHFFDLRCSFLAKTGKPHPSISELADPLYEEFKKRSYIE